MTTALVANDQQVAATILVGTVTVLLSLLIIAVVLTGIAGLIRTPGLLLYIPLGALVIGFIGTAMFGHWQTCAMVGAVVGGIFAVIGAFE